MFNTEFKNSKKIPLIERITSAGSELNASRREMIKEMASLSKKQDIAAMQTFTKAYVNWEIKGRPEGTSKEHAEELAKRNLDDFAHFADALSNNLSEESATLYTVTAHNNPNKQKPGSITSFYRKATSYHPTKI